MTIPTSEQLLSAAENDATDLAKEYLQIFRRYHDEKLSQELAKGIRLAYMAGYAKAIEDSLKVN